MITIDNASLRYPIRGHLSHSLQRTLYHRVGGMLGFGKGGGMIEYVDALRGVNLGAREGERLGVIGHNGAGKTSLLRLISGVYPPSSGRVGVEGRVSALTDITLGMDPNASGFKNIIFRLVFMGYSFKEAREAVEAIVDFSELGDYIGLPVRTYSTGMFLRLAFAISTHFVPDILVMDEVLGAGDLAFQKKALERIRTLCEASRILVLAAHDLASITTYCSRVIVLAHGQIIAQGRPEEMVRFYRDNISTPDLREQPRMALK